MGRVSNAGMLQAVGGWTDDEYDDEKNVRCAMEWKGEEQEL